MLTKIMFRTCTLVLLVNLIACVPDDSVMPKYEADAQLAVFESDPSLPPVSGIPLPSGPTLSVAIQAYVCIQDGETLVATNPGQPGSPPYSQDKFSVKWYRNNQLIGTGAQLSGCVCGEKITVKVENLDTAAKGSAAYTPKPCQSEAAAQRLDL